MPQTLSLTASQAADYISRSRSWCRKFEAIMNEATALEREFVALDIPSAIKEANFEGENAGLTIEGTSSVIDSIRAINQTYSENNNIKNILANR